LFSELAGVLALLVVAAIGAWQFREIVVEDDIRRLQSRAVAILVIGAAGWVLFMLQRGY